MQIDKVSHEVLLDHDISETFYPGAVDLEAVRSRDCEYVMGILPNGDEVIKKITFFGGCHTLVKAVSISLKRLRNQHKPPWNCD